MSLGLDILIEVLRSRRPHRIPWKSFVPGGKMYVVSDGKKEGKMSRRNGLFKGMVWGLKVWEEAMGVKGMIV